MPGADPTGGTGGAPSYLTAMGLTSNQALFDQELAAKTGLSETVIAAWELAEESGSAAQGRQSEGFEDWLNVQVTGSDPAKSFIGFNQGPIVAADDTAEWMMGTLPSSALGEGTTVGGKILATSSGSAASQVAAIGSSGWGTVASLIDSTYAGAEKFAPSNSIPVVTPAVNAGTAIVNAVSNTLDAGEEAVQIAEEVWSAITNPSNWLRALEILGAVIAIYMAMRSLTGVDPAVTIAKGATTVAAASGE